MDLDAQPVTNSKTIIKNLIFGSILCDLELITIVI